jgi:hypothetical protein
LLPLPIPMEVIALLRLLLTRDDVCYSTGTLKQ